MVCIDEAKGLHKITKNAVDCFFKMQMELLITIFFSVERDF